MFQKGLSSENQTQRYALAQFDLLVTRKTLEKSCNYFYAELEILWITMWTNVLIVDNFHLPASSNITLLHRYRPFNWVRADFANESCNTLEEIARTIYAL